MFKSKNLLWVKNVKRDHGSGWAYQEYNIGDFFWLNWSSQFRGNVLKANIGDLLLIFQTVNNPKGTFLTHIVSPIDEILEYDETSAHPYIRKVCVVGVAYPINSIPKPLYLDFKRPNRGATCDIQTIRKMETKEKFKLLEIQNIIFNLFENIDINIDEMLNYVSKEGLDEDEFEEGAQKEILRRHKYYERDKDAVNKAKKLAKANGMFFCEVCKFNFETIYKPIGKGFIECHHKYPIALSGKRKTKVQDLALVCSNCHRMLHRKENNGNYPTIERLISIINKNKT